MDLFSNQTLHAQHKLDSQQLELLNELQHQLQSEQLAAVNELQPLSQQLATMNELQQLAAAMNQPQQSAGVDPPQNLTAVQYLLRSQLLVAVDQLQHQFQSQRLAMAKRVREEFGRQVMRILEETAAMAPPLRRIVRRILLRISFIWPEFG